MTFSDDDLKRLKDYVERSYSAPHERLYEFMTPLMFEALLVRLEAGEDIILDAEQNLGVVS
jgi:hypothetical protein